MLGKSLSCAHILGKLHKKTYWILIHMDMIIESAIYLFICYTGGHLNFSGVRFGLPMQIVTVQNTPTCHSRDLMTLCFDPLSTAIPFREGKLCSG